MPGCVCGDPTHGPWTCEGSPHKTELNPRAKRIDMVQMIGTLDRTISEMLIVAGNIDDYDEPDRQTLKHHAEDMIHAGKAVLARLNIDCHGCGHSQEAHTTLTTVNEYPCTICKCFDYQTPHEGEKA